eukprot:XP_025015686.1 uncharacterized protein LOC107262435 isoform X1 [Ricinus communis]
MPLSLVAHHSLTVKDASVGDQRENLFHTMCLVGTSSLSVIIDSGSYCNILNEKVVRVLNLPTLPHPQPYSLQWISKGKDDVVTRQCHITFSIGTYVDTVTCDVVMMDATHLLLGRPWQYEKKTVDDGFFNTYTFQHKGHRVTLLFMTPQEIIHDHMERDYIKALEQTKEAIKPMATTGPKYSPNLKASTKAEHSTGPATLQVVPTTHEPLSPMKKLGERLESSRSQQSTPAIGTTHSSSLGHLQSPKLDTKCLRNLHL